MRDDMDQGPMIRAARGRLRMTQSALALAAGVSVNTVKRAEAGLPVQDETIRGLCAVLGMDVAVFPRGEAVAPSADPEGPGATEQRATAVALHTPVPWFGDWAPPKAWVRRIFATGFACLIGVLTLASWVHKVLDVRIAFAAPPQPFAWLNPGEVNMLFLSFTLFAMMLFMGAGIVCGLIEARDEDTLSWLRTEADDARTLLACLFCFGMSTPLYDGWGAFQYLVMVAIAPSGDGGLPWLAGWPLIAMQVYLLCALTKLCGPFLRVPPVWPFGLVMSFFVLAHPAHTTPIEIVAGALVAVLTAHVAVTCNPRGIRSGVGGAGPE